MPARSVSRRFAVRSLPLVVVAVIASACGSTPTSPSPSATDSPPPSVVAATPFAFPLLSVETRGGECPQDACGRLINIEADGRIHEVIPQDRVVGTVPPDVIESLRTEIEQADYVAIRGRPFTGECPTAFDGQEIVYTFHVTTGDREVASCEVDDRPE